MKPIKHDQNRITCGVETLERRLLLDGDISASFKGGDLSIRGDGSDNQVVISQPAAGTIRVAGLEETTVNGEEFIDFSAAALDDLKINMRQGGEDQLTVLGPIDIGGAVLAKLGDGEFVVEGTVGPVEIAEDLSVRGGGEGDVKLRNEVIVGGALSIKTGGSATTASSLAILPDFASATFSDSLNIDNPYFPLVVGTTYTYEGESIDDETGETITETVVVEVTSETKTILGVVNRVLRDRVFVNGLLVEDTMDWHAQDDNGNVWYFGEESIDFEYDEQGNLSGMTTEGWEAGVDGAMPGVIMLADPMVGQRYYQEFAPANDALDQGEVLATDETVTIPLGTFNDVLRTKDGSVLEPDELENKHYAPGLGPIQELEFDLVTGEVEETLRLISVELNGVPVTQVVPPDGFAGVNVTGESTDPVEVHGEVSIRAKGQVVLRGSHFADGVEIGAKSQVIGLESIFEDLSIRAADSVGLIDVTATEEVLIRGDLDVYIFNSLFSDEVEIRLGAGDNALVIEGSSLDELEADGGPGEDLFEDRGGNSIDELELTRFEDTGEDEQD